MVQTLKRRKRGEGVSEFPRRLRGLALLLSVIVLICSFPFSASAATSYSVSSVTLQEVYSPDFASRIPIEERFNLPFSFSRSSIEKLEGARITFFIDGDFDKNEVATFEWNSNFNYSDLSGSAILYSSTDLTNSRVGSASIDGNSFTIPVDCSHIEISLYIYCDEGYTPHTFKLDSLSLTVASESSGLLNSILEWLRNIRDKIVGLPDAIGSFITNLGESIKAFFSDLKNNLSTWFDNIGTWFSNLGDNLRQWFSNIGDWFVQLGDNIGNFFENLFNNIKDFFISLFKPREGYFDEVQADLDTFLSAHLGFVYEVPKVAISELQLIYDGLYHGSDELVLPVPELAVYFKGEKYVVVEAQLYRFNDSLNMLPEATLEKFDILLQLGGMVVTGGMVFACARMVYNRVINKVGVEGGDEL